MLSISIKFITWNMGKSVKNINDWNEELKSWTIINSDSDILFITIQETTEEVGNKKFYDALKSKLPNYEIFHKGEGVSNVITGAFYVYGYLCVNKKINITKKPDLTNTQNHMIDTMCIYKSKICTKATIGFGIIINKVKLIFVGSHLPVNTKDVINGSYGYNERVDAMKKIKAEVIDNITKYMGLADYIFWGGDLNMRIQEDETEQLEKILRETPELKEFKEAEKKENIFIKTCRYKELEKIDDYPQFVQKRNEKDGYDPKRNPSYCDRVIYKGLPLLNVKYYTWPKMTSDASDYPPSIAGSDHAVAILEAKINDAQNTKCLPEVNGGSIYNDDIYNHKYIKYKNKYLAIKNKNK